MMLSQTSCALPFTVSRSQASTSQLYNFNTEGQSECKVAFRGKPWENSGYACGERGDSAGENLKNEELLGERGAAVEEEDDECEQADAADE